MGTHPIFESDFDCLTEIEMGDSRPDIPIPDGLQKLMQDFVVTVLRQQPDDLLNHAVEYFNKLKAERDSELGQAEPETGSQVKFATFEEPNNDDDEEEDEEELMMRARLQKMKYNRRQSVSAEGYDPDKDDEDDESEPAIINPKSDEQRTRLNTACNKVLLFNRLETEQFNTVLDAMFEFPAEPGQKIIAEGDDGDNFYVIENGVYDVYKQINDEEAKVASYDNKGSFGELALMYNAPRAATVTSVDGGTLWALDRQTYTRIIVRANAKKRRTYEQFIETVHLLKTLEEFERQKIADAMEPKKFEDGDMIIEQGDTKTDYFYFVMDGEVRFTIRDEAGEEQEIKRDSSGSYFGELALITDKPRAATVYAVGPTTCGVLDIQAFERLLGPCKELLERNIDLYAAELNQILSKDQDE